MKKILVSCALIFISLHAKSDMDVDIKIEFDTENRKYSVEYILPYKLKTIAFNRVGTLDRVQNFQVSKQFIIEKQYGYDVIHRKDGKNFSKITLTFSDFASFRQGDYPLSIEIGVEARLIFLGHLTVAPIVTERDTIYPSFRGFNFTLSTKPKPRKMITVKYLEDSPGYYLIGDAEKKILNNKDIYTYQIPRGINPDLIQKILNELSDTEFNWSKLYVTHQENLKFGLQADFYNDAIHIALKGREWHTPDRDNDIIFSRTFSHEIIHSLPFERNNLREGLADYLSLYTIYKLNIIDFERFLKEISKKINNCLAYSFNPITKTTTNARRKYDCGAAYIHTMVPLSVIQKNSLSTKALFTLIDSKLGSTEPFDIASFLSKQSVKSFIKKQKDNGYGIVKGNPDKNTVKVWLKLALSSLLEESCGFVDVDINTDSQKIILRTTGCEKYTKDIQISTSDETQMLNLYLNVKQSCEKKKTVSVNNNNLRCPEYELSEILAVKLLL
jgi:hypothetical protein